MVKSLKLKLIASPRQTKVNSQVNFSSQRVNKDQRKKRTKNKFVFFYWDRLPNIDTCVCEALQIRTTAVHF